MRLVESYKFSNNNGFETKAPLVYTFELISKINRGVPEWASPAAGHF